jgi:uncharacterized protein YbbC (DUF1343 family)
MKFLFALSILFACSGVAIQGDTQTLQSMNKSGIVVGAAQVDLYLPLLKGKKVAVVANATSTIGTTHLVDSLIALKVNVIKVFAPEHGFRGDHGAGDKVSDSKDPKTGLPLVSLYGKNKKPSAEMFSDIDVVIFDIQDVGARFYTYISTMHYVMETAAETNKSVIILDRPNPNGFYIDGPVLEKEFSSFVGMHPIPVVHGCTVGELARMINSEGWLAGGKTCSLTVVPVLNYSHKDFYELPIAPSPNLPNMSAIYSYPSLCFFEGTIVSVGRGTSLPFQSFGYPGDESGVFNFTPKDIAGVAVDPPFEGKLCNGHDVSVFGEFYFKSHHQLYLEWLVNTYNGYKGADSFFLSSGFFNKLAGNSQLRKDIEAKKSIEEIRSSWASGIENYKKMRKKYLLYEDFE